MFGTHYSNRPRAKVSIPTKHNPPLALIFQGVAATQYSCPFAFVAGRRTGLASVEGAAKASLQARHEPFIARRASRL